jgi:hypothetical protein
MASLVQETAFPVQETVSLIQEMISLTPRAVSWVSETNSRSQEIKIDGTSFI